MATGAKTFLGGANKLKVRANWSKLLDPFFSSSDRLVNGYFCKDKTKFKTETAEPVPQGQFETSQLELSLKSHTFEKFVYLHTHSLVRRATHKYERNIV